MSSPPAVAGSVRIDALDGLRGLAILLVVLLHAMFYGVPLPGVSPVGLDRGYGSVAALGWCGVDVFFVLSGFLITGILLRSKGAPHYFRNFYARRALRIFPLYYVCIGLLLFVLPRPVASTGETLSYLLYWQNFHHALVAPHQDHARLVTWSLAIEEQFYLVWPAVVYWCSRRALARVCLVAIAVAVASRWLLPLLGVAETHFLTPCRVDTLAAGSLLALVGLPGAFWGRLAAVGGALALWTTAALGGSALPGNAPMQRYGLVASLAFAVGLLVLAQQRGWFGACCRWAPLRALGQYSYCVYLVHFFVVEQLAHASYFTLPAAAQQWLAATLSPTALLLLFTAVCLLVSVAVAWLSWHGFEKWCLAWKRHFPAAGERPAG